MATDTTALPQATASLPGYEHDINNLIDTFALLVSTQLLGSPSCHHRAARLAWQVLLSVIMADQLWHCAVCLLQAHDQQCLSLKAFKQLFSEGCYAYLHQVCCCKADVGTSLADLCTSQGVGGSPWDQHKPLAA